MNPFSEHVHLLLRDAVDIDTPSMNLLAFSPTSDGMFPTLAHKPGLTNMCLPNYSLCSTCSRYWRRRVSLVAKTKSSPKREPKHIAPEPPQLVKLPYDPTRDAWKDSTPSMGTLTRFSVC